MITITLTHEEARLANRLLHAHKCVTAKYVRAYELGPRSKARYNKESAIAAAAEEKFGALGI